MFPDDLKSKSTASERKAHNRLRKHAAVVDADLPRHREVDERMRVWWPVDDAPEHESDVHRGAAQDPLHLLQLDLDLQRLLALSRRHRMPPSDDLGHAIHCGLAAMFGELGPSLFAVTRGDSSGARRPGRERKIELLAYCTRSLAELRKQAESYAEPEVFRIIDWDRAADKPMPSRWRAGQRLGFQVRVCPTVRTAKSGPHARAGAEVDAYLAAARRDPKGPKPEREQVYCEWLSVAFDRSEGARACEAVVDRFTLQTLLRRTQGPNRRAKPGLRKPDVTMRGELEVLEPAAFEALLRRGVGRHRVFGFGMLLLRRGRSCS